MNTPLTVEDAGVQLLFWAVALTILYLYGKALLTVIARIVGDPNRKVRTGPRPGRFLDPLPAAVSSTRTPAVPPSASRPHYRRPPALVTVPGFVRHLDASSMATPVHP